MAVEDVSGAGRARLGRIEGPKAYDTLVSTRRAMVSADGRVLVDWHGGDVL